MHIKRRPGFPSWLLPADPDPILGGGGGPLPAPTPTPTPAPVPAPVLSDRGFPADTPVAEMTPDQQIAYWRHHSRQHEAAARRERQRVVELEPLADQIEALRAASQTDTERQIAEVAQRASQEAAARALAVYGPAVIGAELRAALAGRRSPEHVDAIVAGLDLARFIGQDGQVDRDALTAYAQALTAADPAPAPPAPPRMGQGVRPVAPSSGLDAGRDLYRSRHGG